MVAAVDYVQVVGRAYIWFQGIFELQKSPPALFVVASVCLSLSPGCLIEVGGLKEIYL